MLLYRIDMYHIDMFYVPGGQLGPNRQTKKNHFSEL